MEITLETRNLHELEEARQCALRLQYEREVFEKCSLVSDDHHLFKLGDHLGERALITEIVQNEI